MKPTIESLIACADRRLYVAKNHGRNRVIASDDAVGKQLRRSG
jgi:PleD family two-component response regulator